MQTTRVSVFQGVMYVFSIMIVPSKAADPCDSGWLYNENEGSGKCYYVSNAQRTFNSSLSRCRDQGAQLASLATEEENGFIRSLFEDGKVVDAAQEYWLGMYREDGSSSNLRDGWLWLDGTDFNWVNWNTYEPSSGERCARLRTFSSYRWSGQHCSMKYGRICEKDARPPTMTTTLRTITTTTTTTRTTRAATVTKHSLTSANTRSQAESGSFSTSTPSATDNGGCDSRRKEGVLIAVGVIGWCLLVVVAAISCVFFYVMKRRQRLLESRLNGLANGQKHDYEQVVLPPVTGLTEERNIPERSFTHMLTNNKPPYQPGSEKTDATDYENSPDQSVIQYENTGFGSSTSGNARSEDEDTVKYESLRGSERSHRPNQTYTTLSPE